MVQRTLASGGYEAEFYTDTTLDPPIVHYLITRKGEKDILAWGQERSAADAERSAMECMHDLYESVLRQSAG